MNDQQIEQEIQAKGLTAPRVTPANIEANIAGEVYFTAADGYRSSPCYDPNGHAHEPLPAPAPLELLTFCVLVLRNGFTVTGEPFFQRVAHQRPQLLYGVLSGDLAAQLGVEVLGGCAGRLAGHGETVAQHEDAEGQQFERLRSW